MKSTKNFLFLFCAILLVGVLECLTLIGFHLPQNIEIPLLLFLILAVGHETLWHGLIALLNLNFKSINALMLIAVVGAWALGENVEGAVVIILYTLAEKLEEVGIEKSQSAFKELLALMPKFITLKNRDNGTLIESVAVESVQLGEIFLVRPGEMIALDGKVTSGISFVDESSITGEPIPQEKYVGDSVFAGTLNKQGTLEIEVLKRAGETTFAKIQELTYQATETKAPTQQFIETFSEYYTPFVIILAVIWVLFPTLVLGYPFELWFARGLSLIVIACPCAIVISTPISIFSAIGNASKQGVLIKGGKYLEAIGQIQAIALDKTRTLTYGRPVVTDVIPYGDHTKEDVLECAAGIEIFSEHPLAQSIVEAAQKENLTLHPVENFKSFMGKGVQADCCVCSKKHHCIGKPSFILEEHSIPQKITEEVDRLLSEGKTAVVIATHEEIEGVIALTDEIRPESYRLLEGLKELKIKPVLLTGDSFISAKNVAEQLGIQDFQGELLPEDKMNAIKDLIVSHKTVAMVGDGVNDAPALALSSVGITIGSLGSDTAKESASIIILSDRLDVIPFLVKLGRMTIRTIRWNVAFAITVKFIFIVLALLGLSSLALAIFADVGVTFIVILISIRLLFIKF